jgi:hypothetical protein
MLHSENRSPSDPQPLHDKTISAIDTLMALHWGSKPLEEVVTIIRPRSTLALHHQGDSSFVSAFQIAVKHIHCYGYLPKPDKFDAIQLIGTLNKVEFLRPFDVLMVTCGQRIWDVSIAPPETPEPGPGGWVVNRSLAILRANSPDDAICLAAFLRSELAWHAMQEMTPGTVRNHLPDRAMRQIPIPVMTQAYRNQVSAILKKQEALSMKSNEIRNELHKSRTEIWGYKGAV